MEIRFKKRFLLACIRSPAKNFEAEKQKIELRFDPLTGDKVRINVNRTKRMNYQREEFSNLIKASEKDCPFCPQNIETHTSKFLDGKRIIYSGTTIFPNLYPYSSNHAVLVMTPKHYLPLNEIDSHILYNSFLAALKFFKESESCYPSLNFNYMPPAAASLVHPHMQLLSENRPLKYLEILMKRSKAFFNRYKKNYWDLLAATEKKLKERFIGESKYFVFLAKYAPRKNNNILIVSKSISSLLTMNRKQAKDLAQGLAILFEKMHKIGVNSLNLSSFSASKEEQFYRLNFEIITRAKLKPYYTTDLGFMEYMQHEPVAETLPEETAKALYFGKLKAKL